MKTISTKHQSPAQKAVFWIIIVFSLFFFYPMLYVIINSLRESADITRFPTGFPGSFYAGNYVKAWKEMEFPKVFFNTFVITSAGVLGIILTSSMCAYMLARTDTRLSWIIYSIFTFALVIPFQIIMVPIAVLASDFNLTSISGIIPMYWGLGCPTAIFMFHGFVKSVPRELEESAAIDGAGRFYTFFVIVLPLLRTIIATIAVIDALWLWNDFLLPLLVVREGTIQLAQMRFNGQFLKDYGAMTASLTISSLPIILFYLFLQKYIIKGIAAGAVKG
ncbi:MAG: carbohydrate ABC transporter permease [Spirochaetaceae bacterium]|nr:carbohydrate ABC transporter permease [Spirochaetaceae bacterium]